MKGAVSALKALKGSETEMRELLGGTKENVIVGVIFSILSDSKFRQFQAKKTRKIGIILCKI